MFLPQSAAQWQAALNDLPAVLFLLAFVLELVAGITKRESLRATAFWTLVIGAGGAILALLSGLRAESTIEHGGSVHLVMERHKTLAIAVTILFVGLAVWQMWRRGVFASGERRAFLGVSAFGVLGLLWTAHLGGTVVYEFGGGVPTTVLEGALQERSMSHTHGETEEHGDEKAASPDQEQAPAAADHEHE